MGRPSLAPELMIRMLLIGYLYGIRSERRLVEEVHLNLAYRWFCGLGLKGEVPERSSFSKTRHGRFRESDAFRLVFENCKPACGWDWSPSANLALSIRSLKIDISPTLGSRLGSRISLARSVSQRGL
jgi:hypothetical protein